MGTTTYGKVEVEPFEIKIINLLEIIRKPNEHTKLNLTGILDEGVNKSYIEQMIGEKTIKIKAEILVKNKETGESELSKEVIFSGIVENAEVKSASNIYEIKIEGISHSKKLDIELINRSYQDLSMTYKDVMKKAISKYEGDLIDKATEGSTTGEFILCYRETSWDFIKRLSSRFEKPLVPEDKLDGPKVYAGVPDKDEVGELGDFAYSIKKRTSLYRDTKEKYKNKPFETDYIYYEMTTEKIFEIGNKVTFQERTLYVNEADIKMDNGVFANTYKLTEKSGFHENMIKNEQIVGLSLEGEVLDVAKDDVKILLDIDKETPPEDFCWFKYSTPYTSENGGGFYNMPEIGEKVRLHMPDLEEKNAYSTSCVREKFKIEEERGNPDIKYWRTKAGKEIMFTPNGVKIRCLDDEIFLYMIEEKGILMQSNKQINIYANEGAGILLNAEGKIAISAEEEVDIFCNGSFINMQDGITKIRGTSIEDN